MPPPLSPDNPGVLVRARHPVTPFGPAGWQPPQPPAEIAPPKRPSTLPPAHSPEATQQVAPPATRGLALSRCVHAEPVAVRALDGCTSAGARRPARGGLALGAVREHRRHSVRGSTPAAAWVPGPRRPWSRLLRSCLSRPRRSPSCSLHRWSPPPPQGPASVAPDTQGGGASEGTALPFRSPNWSASQPPPPAPLPSYLASMREAEVQAAEAQSRAVAAARAEAERAAGGAGRCGERRDRAGDRRASGRGEGSSRGHGASSGGDRRRRARRDRARRRRARRRRSRRARCDRARGR
jgi:hypothetical protein